MGEGGTVSRLQALSLAQLPRSENNKIRFALRFFRTVHLN